MPPKRKATDDSTGTTSAGKSKAQKVVKASKPKAAANKLASIEHCKS